MKKLLTIMSSLLFTSATVTTSVACETSNNSDSNYKQDPEKIPDSGNNTDDNETSGGDGSGIIELIAVSNIKNKITNINNLPDLGTVNRNLSLQVSDKLYGVKSLNASLVADSTTDVIVLVELMDGFKFIAGENTFEIKGAIKVKENLINILDIQAATKNIGRYNNLDNLNTALQMAAPTGVKLSATMNGNSKTDVIVKVEIIDDWKLIVDANRVTEGSYEIKAVIIFVPENTREDAMLEIPRLFKLAENAYKSYKTLEIAVNTHKDVFEQNRNKSLLFLSTQSPTKEGQIQIVKFGSINGVSNKRVVIYYRFAYIINRVPAWTTDVQNYAQTVIITG